ncbi:hypothetical protein [Deinococcus deserti]|uniref:hypothetical protein n=1 Tax=Deinococcus deserti TaxID=310783 RepID=UPI00031007B1|nr:hypothetical protein [Deinococcus deserti]
MTDAAATREFGQFLNTLAAGQSSGCQSSEYLVWDSSDLAEQVIDNLAAQFKTRGLTYKQLAEEEDDESYSLSFLLTEKSNRYVAVLYGDAESVVLGWCQLKGAPAPAAGKPAPAQAPVKAAPAPAKTAPKAAQAPTPGKYGCAETIPRFLNGSYTYEIETRGYFNLLAGGTYKDVYGGAGRWRLDPATGLTHFSGSGFDRATAELLEGGRLWIVIPTASGERRWTCSRM